MTIIMVMFSGHIFEILRFFFNIHLKTNILYTFRLAYILYLRFNYVDWLYKNVDQRGIKFINDKYNNKVYFTVNGFNLHSIKSL